MKLADLEPQFIRYETRIEWIEFKQQPRHYWIDVASLSEGQGLQFLCPACFAKNSGPVGTHLVEVTFADRGATDEQGSHGKSGKPTRWNASGSSYADLTLTPSILIDGGCGWHGFVTAGEIQ